MAKPTNGSMAEVDCRDESLSESCKCGLDTELDLLLMECQNPLDGTSSKMPNIPARTVISSNSLMQWPKIPASFKKKTLSLILSRNRISSIGDLKNLEALQFLNVSHNQITKIDSSIASLKELYLLDLSFNLLEEVHFEDFVLHSDQNTFEPKKEIFSHLNVLLLNGNRIKQFYYHIFVTYCCP